MTACPVGSSENRKIPSNRCVRGGAVVARCVHVRGAHDGAMPGVGRGRRATRCRVTQSVCAECGEASPSGVQFCPSCGHYLWSSDGPVEEPAVDLHEVSPAVPADPPTGEARPRRPTRRPRTRIRRRRTRPRRPIRRPRSCRGACPRAGRRRTGCAPTRCPRSGCPRTGGGRRSRGGTPRARPRWWWQTATSCSRPPAAEASSCGSGTPRRSSRGTASSSSGRRPGCR